MSTSGTKSGRPYTLAIDRLPLELERGIRMVCARKQMDIRTWIPLLIYEAIDRELADYPEWRWMSKPGEEEALLKSGKRGRAR